MTRPRAERRERERQWRRKTVTTPKHTPPPPPPPAPAKKPARPTKPGDDDHVPTFEETGGIWIIPSPWRQS